MTATNPLESRDALESKYWDARSPATYHVDTDCPIGRWIPTDAVRWGTMTAARGCEACSTSPGPGVPEVRGSYLFAI
ncbi:MAG TPA: hypothetical protein VGZ33_00665 [Acidimicrobiales bacterium]|jgi:hypothetical protein|nr:hypothetical protein [Acidimicrobiales bacterium]